MENTSRFDKNDSMITVIVPVYNTEKYLDRCLESLVDQSWRNLQILLIDDGSNDASPALCDRWAERDRRIRVVHKKNAGLGMARNTGLEQAAGKAVCFLDSDDFLLPQALEKAMDRLCRDGAEVALFGIAWEKGGQRPIHLPRYGYRGREVQEIFLPALLQQKGNLPISSCTALYDLDLIRRTGWRFPSERRIIAEDVYGLLDLYGSVQAVTVLQEALYVYCHNESSLTHSYRPDRFEQVRIFYEACLELCREKNYGELIRRSCAAPFLGFAIGAMKQESRLGNRTAVRDIVRDPAIQRALGENPEEPGIPKRVLLWAMGRSWRLTFWLLRAWQWLRGD